MTTESVTTPQLRPCPLWVACRRSLIGCGHTVWLYELTEGFFNTGRCRWREEWRRPQRCSRTYGNSPPRQAIPATRCLKAGRVAHRRSADPFLADLAELIDEQPSAVVRSGHGLHAYWPQEDGHFGDGSPPGRPSRCCGAGAGWSTRQAGPDSSASLRA